MGTDLVGRETVDVRSPASIQAQREAVELLEVVRGVEELVAPVEPEPAYVLHDGVDVLDVLLRRVGVVEAQVADATILLRQAEVQADALGVTDVQVAVRLGRKASDDPSSVLVGAEVLFDDVANEMRWRLDGARSP